MRHTLYNSSLAAQSLAPASYTASTNGTSVDMGDFRSALLVVSAGAITATHVVKLQESADNVTFTDVAAAHLQGTAPTLAANSVYELGYTGSKRYIRAVATVSGATPSGTYSATIHRTGSSEPVER